MFSSKENRAKELNHRQIYPPGSSFIVDLVEDNYVYESFEHYRPPDLVPKEYRGNPTDKWVSVSMTSQALLLYPRPPYLLTGMNATSSLGR